LTAHHFFAAELLTAVATIYSTPSVLWIVSTDLIFEAVAGPMAGQFPGLIGRSLEDVLGDPDHPGITAARRALQGDRVPYLSNRNGQWWQCIVAPLMGPAGVALGVLGFAKPLVEGGEEPVGPQPCRFAVTQDVPELHLCHGDRVVTYPGADWKARAVRDVSSGDMLHLFSLGVLQPFTPDAGAPGGGDAPASVPDETAPRVLPLRLDRPRQNASSE
jgi:hypothetical protein